MTQNAVDAVINEYNNLYAEKNIHKQQLRKLELIIFYFSSIVSLILYIASSPPILSMLKKDPEEAIDVLSRNLHLISAVISVPYLPIICVLFSFSITETFHIYVLGNHISQLEAKINLLLGRGKLLVWETSVCPVVYNGRVQGESGMKILNLIKVNVGLILSAFAAIVAGLSVYNSYQALQKIDWAWNTYIIVCLYFAVVTAFSGIRLMMYTRDESKLGKAIAQAHSE